MRYRIEHRIATLATHAVLENGQLQPSFAIGAIHFSQWDSGDVDRWLSRFWLAETVVDAADFRKAIRRSWRELMRIVPRIALIGQSYIDVAQQPYLIVREDREVGFFRYIADRGPTGLMFGEAGLKALKHLVSDKSVPDEFYYYWNDAVNAIGYTAKLVLMFSAIEALAKVGKKKDWTKIRQILGDQLVADLFGTKTGLRHRLIHGEHLAAQDSQKNYLELVHKKMISYFNGQILREPLLSEDVVNPQRHPWGNKEGAQWFIKTRNGAKLTLRYAVEDWEKNGLDKLQRHEYVWDDSLADTY
jgi:hypothetical protein